MSASVDDVWIALQVKDLEADVAHLTMHANEGANEGPMDQDAIQVKEA